MYTLSWLGGLSSLSRYKLPERDLQITNFAIAEYRMFCDTSPLLKRYRVSFWCWYECT